jgi:hypothetical protein
LSSPEPRDIRGISTGRVFAGLALVVFGASWLLDITGIAEFNWRVFLPLVLVAVGIVLVLTPGRAHGGMITLGLLLTVVLAISPGQAETTFGEQSHQPTRASEIRRSYRLTAGELDIDLTRVAFPTGTTNVRASVVMGQIVVRIPQDIAFELRGRANAGNIAILGGEERSGVMVRETFSSPGYENANRRLSLNLSVGFGQIEVRRGQVTAAEK